MKNIILYSLLILWLLPISAQTDSTNIKTSSEHTSFIKLGLWPGVTTQGKDYENKSSNISLNLVGDISQNEYGVSISGVFNFVHHKARGLQVAGVANIIAQKGEGVSAALLYNLSKNYDGAMFALGFSSVDHMRGLQSGGFNGALYISGMQLGFSNQTRQMDGVQAGFINFTDTLRGVQLGLINYRKYGGVQIGIVNAARSNDYPIGFINLIKEGHMSIAIEADDRTNTMLTFRSGGRVLYGLIGIGFNFRSDYNHIAVQAGWGVHIPIHKRLSINAELAMVWMSNAHTEKEIEPVAGIVVAKSKERTVARNYNYRSIFKPNVRVLPTFRINDKLSIYAGPSLNYMRTHNPENTHLFPNRSIWKNYKGNSLRQLYIGYMGGVKCSF